LIDVKREARTCWVTGAGGLIGSHVAPAASTSWRAIALTRVDLDFGLFDEVRARFHQDRPNAIIHCAAMSRVAECEQNPDLAHRINVEATELLAQLAASIPFIYVSTDLVFDGAKGNYTEANSPNPLTVYARTKLEGEVAVLKNPRHTVIRTSLNGGASPYGDRSFTEQLITAWRADRVPKLFVDEFRSPIMASETSRAIWEMLDGGYTGLFHIAGAERLSRYQIGELLAPYVPRLNPQIEPASLRDYPGPPRAPDTSLVSDKAAALLSFPLPRFSDWLEKNWPIEP
jgi:dTDP-4-dehydrorhamnose reductase